jgi:hypothetical protein
MGSTLRHGSKVSPHQAGSASLLTPGVTSEERLPAEFVDLGEQQLKNIADPAHVFAIAPAA